MSEPPSMQVAVPVVSAAPALEHCLRALADVSIAPVVVTAGMHGRAAEALTERVEALLPDATIVREPLPGRAQARNRALAVCDADVIAYVDPDMVVEADWCVALQDGWAAASPELGCLGGPIRVDFPAGRPRWLGDALLSSFGPLDYGSRPLDLDPLERTLMGGNVSFRASALRGVGGFWPARGRDDQLDWFSEEHHAQRELARVGWRARYEPALAARRLAGAGVTPSAVLRRRRAYGARLALVGSGRTAATAMRETVKGGVGAGAAMVTGRPALALARMARAAENVGVLAPRRVAAGDLEPVAARTPFRHSVPLPQTRRPLPTPGGGPRVLLYHRVATPPADPLGLCVSPAHFAEHVEILRERRLLGLSELGPDAPEDAVAITFDDGYGDNVAALRRLAAAGVPATLFVSTGHVEEGRWFWWDELDVVLRAASDAQRPPLAIDDRAWAPRDATERASVRGHLHQWLASLHPDGAAAAVAAVRSWAGAPDARPPEEYRPITVDELDEVAALPGIEIGAHTRNHPSLHSVAPEVAETEIARSRDDLERWLGAPPRSFSYPFGIPGVDFTETTRSQVAAAGFELAVSNAPGALSAATSRFALPRHIPPDVGGDEFARWLGVEARQRQPLTG